VTFEYDHEVAVGRLTSRTRRAFILRSVARRMRGCSYLPAVAPGLQGPGHKGRRPAEIEEQVV
jgi:hypothetical protein